MQKVLQGVHPCSPFDSFHKAFEAFYNTVHHFRTGIFALSRGINFPRFFTIDSNGKPYSMKLNGIVYYYELNLQGDVIGLIDSNNNVVVNYTYDSWGNLQSIGGSLAGTLGKKNPLRYRGYYYDAETGMYYLQSRYYSPEIGRFISRDDAQYHEGDTGVKANLYAYCDNNPVMNSDPSGNYSWKDFFRSRRFVPGAINVLISIAIGGAVGAISKNLIKLAAKQGRYAAKRWLTAQIRAKFARVALKTAFKAKILSVIGLLLTIVTNFFDIGGWIFDYIDSRDKHPRNGYWDF